MLILAMEASSKSASVAVCSDGNLLGQYIQNSGLTHSRTLLAMAESLLKNLDLAATDIGLVAVSHGPGSFTGVRIGVSAAKGLAWGIDKPVCGVSTLESMAYQSPETGMLVCPVMDARRSQVYNALFRWEGGAPVRLCDDRAISLEALAAGLRAQPLLESLQPSIVDSGCAAGFPNSRPHLTQNSECPSLILLMGEGAELSYEYLAAEGIPCRVAPVLLRWQTAYGVALAALHGEPIPANALESVYLRPSQAERERQIRESGG